MRYGVLAPGTNNSPHMWIDKQKRDLLLRARLCRRVKGQKDLIQELKNGAANSDVRRFLKSNHSVIKDLTPRGLLLQYPIADQTSYRRANRKRIWKLTR